jgi:hypothetical protein
VSENRVLRRIFVSKREEVAGGFRTPQNEQLHNLYASPNIINVIKSGRMRWEGNVASMGKMINVYKIMVRKPERERPLGRPERKWEHNM